MMELNFWTVFLTYLWAQQKGNNDEVLMGLPYWERHVEQLTKENNGDYCGVIIVESNSFDHQGKYRFYCTPSGISVEHQPVQDGPSYTSVPVKNNRKFTPTPSWEKYCRAFGYH